MTTPKPTLDLDALEAMRSALDALTVGSGEWILAWERYADTCAYAAPALIAAARERDALKAALKQAVEALQEIAHSHDGNPPLSLADIPEIDYAKRTISNMNRRARSTIAALQETKP